MRPQGSPFTSQSLSFHIRAGLESALCSQAKKPHKYWCPLAPTSGHRQALQGGVFWDRRMDPLLFSAEPANGVTRRALRFVLWNRTKLGFSPSCSPSRSPPSSAGPGAPQFCRLPGWLAEPGASVWSPHVEDPRPRAHKSELTFLKQCAGFLRAPEASLIVLI